MLHAGRGATQESELRQLGAGQDEVESAALSVYAGTRHACRAAQLLHDPLDDGQPQTVTLGPGLIEPLEGNEETRLLVFGEAASVVLDPEL